MYYAQIDDYYVRDGAWYYHVVGRLDLAPILKHRLNRSEQQAEAVAVGSWSSIGWRTGIMRRPSRAFIPTVRWRSRSTAPPIIPPCATRRSWSMCATSTFPALCAAGVPMRRFRARKAAGKREKQRAAHSKQRIVFGETAQLRLRRFFCLSKPPSCAYGE